MSIRTLLLAAIFSVMLLFLSAAAWLSFRIASGLEREITRSMSRELLNEGASDFLTAARHFCGLYEGLPEPLRSADPGEALAPLKTAAPGLSHLIFEAQGAPRAGWEPAPGVEGLITSEQVAGLMAAAAGGGDDELVVDNFSAYLEGEAEQPAMVYLRAFPDRGTVVGLGRVHDSTSIRVGAFSEAIGGALDRVFRQGSGLYLALSIVALALIWTALQQLFFSPLARTMALAGGGVGSMGRLTWARFREYATRVGRLEEEKSALRQKLEREIEVRFQAEEERDQLRGNQERALRAWRMDLNTQAEEKLRACQADIMRREGRVLSHYMKPGLNDALEAAARGDISDARERISRCLAVVDALASEQAPRGELAEEFDLRPWLEGVVGDFSRKRDVPIQTNIANGTRIKAEPSTLRQAVEFVMENATIASGDGGIRVDATPTGDGVEIRVIDGGPGIPEDVRPHIFTPFFSLDARADGLGLAITRSVVEGHGGSLQVHSESDKGTAVVIRLPAQPTH